VIFFGSLLLQNGQFIEVGLRAIKAWYFLSAFRLLERKNNVLWIRLGSLQLYKDLKYKYMRKLTAYGSRSFSIMWLKCFSYILGAKTRHSLQHMSQSLQK